MKIRGDPGNIAEGFDATYILQVIKGIHKKDIFT